VIIATDAETLARWHMGELTLSQAAENASMRVLGSPRLVRALQTWGGQTPFDKEGIKAP
jgi:hypothetical protein